MKILLLFLFIRLAIISNSQWQHRDHGDPHPPIHSLVLEQVKGKSKYINQAGHLIQCTIDFVN